MKLRYVVAITANFQLPKAVTQYDRYPADARDLWSFHSRPDLKPPRLNLSMYDEAQLSQGCLFLAPYVDLLPRARTSLSTPSQIGPHIYDRNGELIWSGAHLFKDRSVFDFKVSHINNIPHLSFILLQDPHASEHRAGTNVILDRKYNILTTLNAPGGQGLADMHEFNVLGRSSLLISSNPRYVNDRTKGQSEINGWILDEGFVEIDTETGEKLFEWWALDHVHACESVRHDPSPSNKDAESAWDFFHANSIDKTPSGNYILSARYTSTVYLISGKDGSILWRLGGKLSSFTHIGNFSFAYQHDARMISENATTSIVSLLDNASNDALQSNVSASSNALYVVLDKVAHTASVLKSFPRPDSGLTRLRGNVQTLPNGNTLVGWSDNSYLSEYSAADNSLILEGQFASQRFVSYRSFKFPWVSFAPEEPPRVVAVTHGTRPEKSVTEMFVSWNGATEVVTWRFWECPKTVQSYEGKRELTQCRVVGEVDRTGFETMLVVEGYLETVFVEGFMEDGRKLGETAEFDVEKPDSWSQNPLMDEESPRSLCAGQALAGCQIGTELGAFRWVESRVIAATFNAQTGLVMFCSLLSAAFLIGCLYVSLVHKRK